MEEQSGIKWKDRPWVLENLPTWKRIFKFLGRFLMVVIYYGLVIGGFVVLDLEGSQLSSPGLMDFFGVFLPTYVVAIIGGIVIFGIGALGSIVSTVMLVHFFSKKPFKLGWKPKIGVAVVLVIALVGVQYYVPYWTVQLGLGQPSYGPYLAIYDQNTMEVSWDTPTPVQSTLDWGISASALPNALVAHAMYNSTEIVAQHHMVLITGLTPGDTYYYTIPGFDSNVYAFKMAPSSDTQENVTFTIVGDTHGNLNICRQNIAIMRQTAPNLAFTMIAGDLCTRDDDNYEWAALFDKTSYGALASTIPWMNVCGNHETYSTNPSSPYRGDYKTYFEYNYANSRTVQPGLTDYGLYYSFNYSDVHVTVMDCMENTSGYFSTAQIQWLINDLANNPNMWKFVSFHYPMYSTGDPKSLTDMDSILEPIFYQYHVDGVFWGHAHNFEAFTTNNTYYFTLGQGGGTLDPLTSVSTYGSHAWPSTKLNVSQTGTQFNDVYGHQYQLYGELTYGFMEVSVHGNSSCTFTDYRSDGSIVVAYTITH